MIEKGVYNFLIENEIDYKLNQKASDLVSIKVGGYVDIVAYPSSFKEICLLLNYLIESSTKYFLLGNGTNLYFSDKDYNGVVIVTKKLNQIYINDGCIACDTGASINQVCLFARRNSLSGLEFAYGIPGTIGGALYMNASAFGGSFSDVVLKSIVYDKKTKSIRVLQAKEHLFDKKQSVFSLESQLILLKTYLSLQKDNKEKIELKMKENAKKRVITQPLDMPSAGSVFKRPKNGYASKLIDECGLKGLRIGGAEVSRKHAGFIVNLGDASASDINKLIQIIKKEVYNRFQVRLDEEILFVE